jgi:hypothetical protein
MITQRLDLKEGRQHVIQIWLVRKVTGILNLMTKFVTVKLQIQIKDSSAKK